MTTKGIVLTPKSQGYRIAVQLSIILASESEEKVLALAGEIQRNVAQKVIDQLDKKHVGAQVQVIANITKGDIGMAAPPDIHAHA